MAILGSLIIFSLVIAGIMQAVNADELKFCPIFPCDKTIKYVTGFFVGQTIDGNNVPELGPPLLCQDTTSADLSSIAPTDGASGQQTLASLPTAVVKSCVDFCNQYNKDSLVNGGTLALYWTFELKQTTDDTGGGKFSGKCYCYSPDVCDKVGPVFDERNTPLGQSSSWSLFVTGNLCLSDINGDPHFTGADQSHFDFTGLPNQQYALLSDHDLQVNAYFGGRYDESSSPPKALNWIRKVGILWKSHTLVLEAREGPEWKYGNGYMQRILVDNHVVHMESPGESAEFNFPGEVDLKITWQLAEEPSGNDVVDKYEVKLGEILTISLTLRPEVEALRTPGDGVVHFAIGFVDAKLSKDVHGVIGQTYRPDFVGRLDKQALVWNDLLQKKVVATENAEGFIDGKPEDYMVSSLLSADCRFSRFYSAPVSVSRKLLL